MSASVRNGIAPAAPASDGAAIRADHGRRRLRTVAPHEFLPSWFIYAPVVAQWLWLGLRHRAAMLPCLANPHVASGGLCGESKTAILDAVGAVQKHRIAPYALLAAGDTALAEADAAMARLRLDFPVVLKPDVGCKGAGVRLIGDRTRLAETLGLYPAGVRLVLQEFIPWEGEAGIFYSRHPDARRGRILAMTLKHAPHVEGDGVRTLRALIAAHPRAGRVPHVYLPRLAARGDGVLDRVLAKGERFRLVFTGNHSKGSLFHDASAEVTPALEAAIDALVRSMPEFHHGRIDLRYADLAALRRGEDWRVIEINGIGSEPIQMWDPNRSLASAWRTLLRFHAEAFRIGQAMRARGYATPSAFDVFTLWREQGRLIAGYPSSD